ncbi:dopamine beta-hydroxylase-like [Gigantopelta aegis]|uniref:dopamine beta-hydroxylase-like n=1 Tax=Gigantopelta aegis TaxID=1735272 RepID=UPI001B88BD8B|nr:dopamine beta-hydroxylase-like [Gigantopelta aegis]
MECNYHLFLLLMTWTLYVSAVPFGNFSGNYRYNLILDPTHDIHFFWDVDYRRNLVHVKIVSRVPETSWFGVGFSDYGESTFADFVVFWTNSQGTHHFQDTWTDGKGILHIDSSQDYVLERGKTQWDMTVLEFSRHFETCDGKDYQLDNGTTHIVYFVSEGNPRSITGHNVTAAYHGLQRVQLLKPDINLARFPPDVWTFEILAPKVHVPPVETTYWWYTTTLPPLPNKQHIIQYEGVIEPTSKNLVHHIEVFYCVGVSGRLPFYNGPGLAEGKPPELASCRNVIGAWAMGAGPIAYPEEAGYAIGGRGFSQFILLEVHYNNPRFIKGVVDSSGIRFYVSPTPRKYDAGILELGLEYTNKMALPPGQDLFKLIGYCIRECTSIALPRRGIKIFASQLHTHLTGKAVYTKHVRDGVELPELNRDDHYSPHFQEIRRLPEPVHILPNDALITVCEDSTKDRKHVTVGGFSISQEMCVNYVHYYPKSDLEVCKSSVDTRALNGFFEFMNRMEKMPTSAKKGDIDNYNSIDWTPLNSHLLKHLYATSPLSMQCNQSNGDRFPGYWDGMPLTRIIVPLPNEPSSCPRWQHYR